MVYKGKNPPADFDENSDFFDHLVFDKNNCDFDEQFSGVSYLIELFMHSQSKAHMIGVFEKIVACFFMAFAGLIAAIAMDAVNMSEVWKSAISSPSYSALILLCFL